MSDLINGREMLKKLHNELCYDIACNDCSMCTEDGGCRVEEWIDKFPSADRPQGEWIVSSKDSICPICGKDEAEFICGTEDWYGYGLSNYCPNCGARMKGVENDTSIRL